MSQFEYVSNQLLMVCVLRGSLHYACQFLQPDDERGMRQGLVVIDLLVLPCADHDAFHAMNDVPMEWTRVLQIFKYIIIGSCPCLPPYPTLTEPFLNQVQAMTPAPFSQASENSSQSRDAC